MYVKEKNQRDVPGLKHEKNVNERIEKLPFLLTKRKQSSGHVSAVASPPGAPTVSSTYIHVCKCLEAELDREGAGGRVPLNIGGK